MEHYYWNNWYTGWGWFLWYGVIFLFIASFGNWGYTYQAHRKFGYGLDKKPIDILDQRYARGDIKHEEYLQIKKHLLQGSTTSPA